MERVEEGMILVSYYDKEIILINSRLTTVLGKVFILYVKLEDINVGMPLRIYSKFEELILEHYRLATIEEVEVNLKTKICNLLKMLTPKYLINEKR